MLIEVTASIGVHQVDPQAEAIDAALHAADEALYQAKNEGRDCVRLWRRPQTAPA